MATARREAGEGVAMATGGRGAAVGQATGGGGRGGEPVAMATEGRGEHLWSGGSASRSLAGSLVSGMTPMMVLLSDVPFSRRLRTSCMFPGESTLARMVEPGSSTASGVSSSGRRLGIWMALPPDEDEDAMAALGSGPAAAAGQSPRLA